MSSATQSDALKAAARHETKLSTSSPEALRVAAEITPTRLANLLIRKGPLAIRLITAQLSIEVPGFELLSLSKQRRLIMAAMEQEDPKNNVVFEKIGWGQWAVRRADSDYIVTDNTSAYPRVSVQELKEKAKLGWLKKAEPGAEHAQHNGAVHPESEHLALSSTRVQKLSNRRDSITNHKKSLHNTRLPSEKLDDKNAVLSDSELDSEQLDLPDETMADDMVTDDTSHSHNAKLRANLANTRLADIDDNAIAEDLDEDDDDDDDDDDEEESLFKFDDDEYPQTQNRTTFRKSPPVKFANRVPTKFSPPPNISGGRRKLSSATVNAVSKNTSFSTSTRQTIFSRSRLNSLENLDNYIVSSARNSAVSISSPVPMAQPGSVTSSSPLGSWSSKTDPQYYNELHVTPEHFASAFSRRKLSFNESNIRSTLSHSLPPAPPNLKSSEDVQHTAVPAVQLPSTEDTEMDVVADDGASDTDEEDWATMGAETLRKHSTGLSSPAGNSLKNEERTAARALVNLMGN